MMRLRTKIYFMAVGFYSAGALIGALAHAAFLTGFSFLMAYLFWNWANHFLEEEAMRIKGDNNGI